MGKHVNSSLVRQTEQELTSSESQLDKCFHPQFWGEILNLSEHFSEQRSKHGADYDLRFASVEPYLKEVVFNDEEEKLYVEVDYFSQYRFAFEDEDLGAEIRHNSVTFEMETTQPDPRFVIVRST